MQYNCGFMDVEQLCKFSRRNSAIRASCLNGLRNSSGPFNYPHTIGVLGANCARSTAEFMRKVAEATSEQDFHIPLVVCSDARKVESAGSASYLKDLVQQRDFLEQAGARCIVMPCHSSHLWYQELSCASSVPFLNMTDCMVEELKAAKLQPLPGVTKPRIGVLAFDFEALETFQRKLEQEGFEVAVPDKAEIDRLLLPAAAALRRRDHQGYKSLLRIAVQNLLLVNSVNLVVGDGIPAAFPANDPLQFQCLDPTHSLARATLAWAKMQVFNDLKS